MTTEQRQIVAGLLAADRKDQQNYAEGYLRLAETRPADAEHYTAAASDCQARAEAVDAALVFMECGSPLPPSGRATKTAGDCRTPQG